MVAFGDRAARATAAPIGAASKSEIRETLAGDFADTGWTTSFTVLEKAVQHNHAQVIEEAHYVSASADLRFVVGMSWIRDGGEWKLILDQSTPLPES